MYLEVAYSQKALSSISQNWSESKKFSEIKPPLDKYSFCWYNTKNLLKFYCLTYNYCYIHLLQNYDSYIEKFGVCMYVLDTI